MSGTLLVALPGLSGFHRDRIRTAAEAHGLRTVFSDSRSEALREAPGAEILFTQDPGLARSAAHLRWLCTPSAGTDHFAGALAPETLLTSSSGAYGVTIAEHIVMVTLEMMRRIREYEQIVLKREWRRDLPICSVHGARVTLLGTGDIGQETAKRLRAFDPERITGVNRRGGNPQELFDEAVTADELPRVLKETDLLVMSLPQTDETRGIMSAERLALLPENAYLVNVGRGSALDQKALEERLRSGKLAGAALDVFEKEPVPQEDSLWDCPRLILTPHVAGNMTLPYTVERIVSLFLENLELYCAGRPLLRLVDRARGY